MIKDSDILLKLFYNSFKNACAKDEQGNFCPYSYVNIQKNDSLDIIDYKVETYMEYIKESCKSKKCVDEYLSYIEDMNEIYSITKAEEFRFRNEKEISSLLKSETCTAQIANSSNNVSNVNNNGKTDASNTNINGNTNVSNGTANGNTNVSNVISNSKTDTSSNNNNNVKTDAKSGATQITYSNVLFVSLAILLSILF